MYLWWFVLGLYYCSCFSGLHFGHKFPFRNQLFLFQGLSPWKDGIPKGNSSEPTPVFQVHFRCYVRFLGRICCWNLCVFDFCLPLIGQKIDQQLCGDVLPHLLNPLGWCFFQMRRMGLVYLPTFTHRFKPNVGRYNRVPWIIFCFFFICRSYWSGIRDFEKKYHDYLQMLCEKMKLLGVLGLLGLTKSSWVFGRSDEEGH